MRVYTCSTHLHGPVREYAKHANQDLAMEQMLQLGRKREMIRNRCGDGLIRPSQVRQGSRRRKKRPADWRLGPWTATSRELLSAQLSSQRSSPTPFSVFFTQIRMRAMWVWSLKGLEGAWCCLKGLQGGIGSFGTGVTYGCS